MTWIIHGPDRKRSYNASACRSIILQDECIGLDYGGPMVPLAFENSAEAAQAFKYLMEALQRKDGVVQL